MRTQLAAAFFVSLLMLGAETESRQQPTGTKFAKAAESEAEWTALMKQSQSNAYVVRSLKDWNVLVASADNPLKGIDRTTTEAFTKELVFLNGGLAGASYGMLESKLSADQFSALWAKFGLGVRLLADHKGYRCAGKGTCSPATTNICTSNCNSSDVVSQDSGCPR